MPTPAPDKATELEVKRLLKRLARLKGDWPSEPTLRDLSPQMVEALLRRVAQKDRADTLMGIVAGATLMLCYYFAHGTMNSGYGGSMVTGWLIGTIMQARQKLRKRYSVYALTQTQDIRVLPTLIHATRIKWGQQPEVLSAINRLLLQVMETNAGLLSQKMQNRLWNLAIVPTQLETGNYEALASSALQAFAHIGNRETLNRMHSVTRNPNGYPISQRVIALMEQLIPTMEARLQRQEVPQTLLRAADATSAQPATLLRAAHSSTPEPTAQLLRASTSEHCEAETQRIASQ